MSAEVIRLRAELEATKQELARYKALATHPSPDRGCQMTSLNFHGKDLVCEYEWSDGEAVCVRVFTNAKTDIAEFFGAALDMAVTRRLRDEWTEDCAYEQSILAADMSEARAEAAFAGYVL